MTPGLRGSPPWHDESIRRGTGDGLRGEDPATKRPDPEEDLPGGRGRLTPSGELLHWQAGVAMTPALTFIKSRRDIFLALKGLIFFSF